MPELLLAAVQEVPLLVYGESSRLTRDDDLKRSEGDKLWHMASSISSIYFDSPTMSLYNARVRVRSDCCVLGEPIFSDPHLPHSQSPPSALKERNSSVYDGTGKSPKGRN